MGYRIVYGIQEISELYFIESIALCDYWDECKNKVLELFSKWFWFWEYIAFMRNCGIYGVKYIGYYICYKCSVLSI